MPDKQKINRILSVLRLSDEPMTFVGSYDNPDFDHFSDVDVDQKIKLTDKTPHAIKNMLERIKKYGPKLGFSFLELKLGTNPENYFRSEHLDDYNRRFNKSFKDINEAKEYVNDIYTQRIHNVDASLDEIKTKLKKPNMIKLDVIVKDQPNFTIEVVYIFKPYMLNIIKELLDDIDTKKDEGKWSKVAKRIYSISKYIDDNKRKNQVLDILKPHLKKIWLNSTLDLPQSQEWIDYVNSFNINIDAIQEDIKNKLNNNMLI